MNIPYETRPFDKILYYECHITIEPVLHEMRRKVLAQLLSEFDFRLAELLFQRNREDTPERSAKDSFCTSRDSDFYRLEARMHWCIAQLRNQSFEVWRYKIEAAIVDVRIRVPKLPRESKFVLELNPGRMASIDPLYWIETLPKDDA